MKLGPETLMTNSLGWGLDTRFSLMCCSVRCVCRFPAEAPTQKGVTSPTFRESLEHCRVTAGTPVIKHGSEAGQRSQEAQHPDSTEPGWARHPFCHPQTRGKLHPAPHELSTCLCLVQSALMLCDRPSPAAPSVWFRRNPAC